MPIVFSTTSHLIYRCPVDASVLSDRQEVRCAHGALLIWKTKMVDYQRLQDMAYTEDHRRLLKQALGNWRTKIARSNRLGEAARLTDTFFRLRATFRIWQSAIQSKKQEDWILQKSKKDSRVCFECK
jgi:hypothetical protein